MGISIPWPSRIVAHDGNCQILFFYQWFQGLKKAPPSFAVFCGAEAFKKTNAWCCSSAPPNPTNPKRHPVLKVGQQQSCRWVVLSTILANPIWGFAHIFSKIGNKWVGKITTSMLIYDLTWHIFQVGGKPPPRMLDILNFFNKRFLQTQTPAISSSTFLGSNLWCFLSKKLPFLDRWKFPVSSWNGHVQGLTESIQNSPRSVENFHGAWNLSPNKWKIFLKIQILLNIDVLFGWFPPFLKKWCSTNSTPPNSMMISKWQQKFQQFLFVFMFL